jgi:RecB family endonuclease NucS
MAGFSQNKAGLAALDPESVCEQGGIIIPPVRRVGVHLGVESLQFGRVRGGLRAVEQLGRYVGRGHEHLL